jgi:hypothetical protein
MFKVYFSIPFLCLLFMGQLSAQSKPKPKATATPSPKNRDASTVKKPQTAAQTAPKPKSLNLTTFENAMKDVPLESTFSATFTEMSKNFLGHDSYFIPTISEVEKKNGGHVKLQKPGREVLYIDMEVFDCQSFIEYTLALTQARRLSAPTYEAFKERVKRLRYRNAEVSYGARLHYFSDWIYTNEKQGILKDVTQAIGGESFNKDIHYMSAKKDTFYGNMADPETYAVVRGVEKNLTARQKYYVPKNKIASIEANIKDGDIIAITNASEGMDVAHCGVAYWQGKRLHLMHASSDLGFVVVTQEPLAEYLLTHAKHTGIMVARLVD